MAAIKKYNGSTWETTTARKYETKSEIITPPTTIYADGNNITTYAIKGDTVQNGTPTPSNPVDVNGVGVRTENWFDYNTMKDGKTGYYLDASGNEISNEGYWSITKYIPVDGTTFTLTRTFGGNVPAICLYDTNKNYIAGVAYQGERDVTISSNTNAAYIRFSYFIGEPLEDVAHDMLNSGSTAKPFEPYGYKIPISNGQQTIDIYIGDLPLLKSLDGTAVDEISNGTLTRRVDADGSVLPTPTTTQITMPSIPTTEGANSITVDTTVQPSEFTATWTGWHNASVKEWDGSQWNE